MEDLIFAGLSLAVLVLVGVVLYQNQQIRNARHERDMADRLRLRAEEAVELTIAAVKREKASREWPEYVEDEI